MWATMVRLKAYGLAFKHMSASEGDLGQPKIPFIAHVACNRREKHRVDTNYSRSEILADQAGPQHITKFSDPRVSVSERASAASWSLHPTP